MKKEKRLLIIKELISRYEIKTQEELVQLLHMNG
ncbi:arginine repressor, partial [Bacillaceae bacterium Marseille-Q3522]|nr:arginine repressor [Bacillaceae bacterium Marseille-Q3522]